MSRRSEYSANVALASTRPGLSTTAWRTRLSLLSRIVAAVVGLRYA